VINLKRMFTAQVPAKLWCVAAIAVVALAAVTVVLAWHALRRLLGVPRVPRPPATYLALSALWVVLVASCSATLAMILLLRDHHRVDAHTELADVRCEAVGPDQLRMELRTSHATTPEWYELRGGACLVSVKQVRLWPGFALLGVGGLSRIDSVGSLARQGANPEWLMPRASAERRLIDLVVRKTEAVDVEVPPDTSSRAVLVTSPSGPTLERRPI
jgi:hypothetical protein